MIQPQIEQKTYLRKTIEDNEDIQYWLRELLITDNQVDRIIDIVNQAVQQMPRSSPQVAPGLRDDAARSIKEFELWVESKGYARKNGDFDLSPYSGQLDGPRYKSYLTESWFEIWTASRAADIAAAQGGTVVDLCKLRDRLTEDIEAADQMGRKVTREGLGHTALAIASERRTLQALLTALDQGEFNSAVPSAPGGPSTLQTAWDEFDKQLIPVTFTPGLMAAYTRLREALGQPQGSDSLRLDWLQKNLAWLYVGREGWFIDHRDGSRTAYYPATLDGVRKVIDAAMELEEKREK